MRDNKVHQCNSCNKEWTHVDKFKCCNRVGDCPECSSSCREFFDNTGEWWEYIDPLLAFVLKVREGGVDGAKKTI